MQMEMMLILVHTLILSNYFVLFVKKFVLFAKVFNIYKPFQ